MNRELFEKFFTSMMRFKKMESIFSAECDMQISEMTILQSIAGECSCPKSPGMNLNMPDIQEKLQITKPAISYILNALEKKAYITREIDPKDRRKISINITPEGKAAAKAGAEKSAEMWDALVEYLGKDDVRELIDLLTRLTDFWESYRKDQKR